MERVTDILTGTVYDLSHLASHVLPFYLLINGQQVHVDLHVFYANHCFTRSRTSEPDEAVLFLEKRRNSPDDERVFCKRRYDFSLQLPQVLAELNQAMCYRGSDNSVFYRLKSDLKARSRVYGWYVCGRLDASAMHQQLRLNIRSVHYRTNEPHGIRGSARFYEILRPFYERQKAKHPWV